MVEVFSYILKSLLADEASVVKVRVGEKEDKLFFYLTIPHRLKSRIIGRDGKVINAIKDYLKTISKKFGNKKIFVRINEV